jgi:hypothetical protein
MGGGTTWSAEIEKTVPFSADGRSSWRALSVAAVPKRDATSPESRERAYRNASTRSRAAPRAARHTPAGAAHPGRRGTPRIRAAHPAYLARGAAHPTYPARRTPRTPARGAAHPAVYSAHLPTPHTLRPVRPPRTSHPPRTPAPCAHPPRRAHAPRAPRPAPRTPRPAPRTPHPASTGSSASYWTVSLNLCAPLSRWARACARSVRIVQAALWPGAFSRKFSS